MWKTSRYINETHFSPYKNQNDKRNLYSPLRIHLQHISKKLFLFQQRNNKQNVISDTQPRTYSKHAAIEKTQHCRPRASSSTIRVLLSPIFFAFQLKNRPTMDRAESQFSLHDLVSASEPVHKSGRPSDNDEWIPISTRCRIVCRPWIRDRNCQSRLLPACQSEKVAKCSKKAERFFKV